MWGSPIMDYYMRAPRTGAATATPTITNVAASTEFSGTFAATKARDADSSSRWSSSGADDPYYTITLSGAAKVLAVGEMLGTAPGQGVGKFHLAWADGGGFTNVTGGPFEIIGWATGSYVAGNTHWTGSGVIPDEGAHTQWRIIPTITIDNTTIGALGGQTRFVSVAEFYFATDGAHATLITGP
jgi:hypothetical protein